MENSYNFGHSCKKICKKRLRAVTLFSSQHFVMSFVTALSKESWGSNILSYNSPIFHFGEKIQKTITLNELNDYL